MLYTDFSEKVLGLQGAIIKKIETDKENINLFCEMERKVCKCPVCSAQTDKIHDYRTQIIKDIPIKGKKVFIHLRKRRYRCSCGKRFYEDNSFLPKYHRMTKPLAEYVINELRNTDSFTRIAKANNLSVSTVIRIFDLVSYPKPKLPETVSIDEFKGDILEQKNINALLLIL